MPLTRRQWARLTLGGAVATLIAACQAPSSAPPTQPPSVAPTAANPLVKPRATGAELTAVQASTELAVGRNRFAIGLIDARNQPVTAGEVNVEFFKLLANGQAEKRAQSAAIFRSVGGASKGIWVTPATFSEVGPWGAQVTLDSGDGAPKASRMSFQVRESFSAPGYDDAAPRSASPTDRDVGGDTSHICSNTPPCDLHGMSIAEALDGGQKPLVVLFATPALCTSATCAPELQAVEQLHGSYAEVANFIHVEIYQYPFDGLHTAKTVDEWHLPSDPWTFIVDRGGVVRDRFEGAAPVEELEPSLKTLLG
ncbi:MAG TPA: hypothetical protein VF937_14000 [Chloroflexota bacterium]